MRMVVCIGEAGGISIPASCGQLDTTDIKTKSIFGRPGIEEDVSTWPVVYKHISIRQS